MVEQEVLDCMNDIINTVVKKENNRIAVIKYSEKNKEKVKQKQKEYRQTINGIKSYRISHWKRQGVVCDNFDALYDHYTKTAYCDLCRVELTYDKYNTATTKCLDHDHSITDRPNFRNILCNSCNLQRK